MFNSYGECLDGGWVDWFILVFFLEGVWRVEVVGGVLFVDELYV